MIILSQDKKGLVKFKNIVEYSKNCNCYNLVVDDVIVGKFNAEERAKEIVMEIAYAVIKNAKVYSVPEV